MNEPETKENNQKKIWHFFFVFVKQLATSIPQVTHIYDLTNNTDTIIIAIKNSNKIIFKNILIEHFYKLSKKKKTKINRRKCLFIEPSRYFGKNTVGKFCLSCPSTCGLLFSVPQYFHFINCFTNFKIPIQVKV